MSQSDSLEQLALARFGSLSEAERRLARAAPNGDTAYCGPSEDPNDPANHPSGSEHWDQRREINAEFIRWLCNSQAAKTCIDPRGIRVYAARISGVLDLSYIEIPFPLVLVRCRLSGHFNLDFTEIPDLDLAGTWVEKMSAEYASIKGCIVLKEGFYARGPVELTGVQIGGNLECNSGRFENPAKKEVETSGAALNAENAGIAGDVLLRDGFLAIGSVWFSGAQIGGNFECWGGKFENPGLKNSKAKLGAAESGKALTADDINVHCTVMLGDGFSARGMVSFNGAQIGGDFDCDGGRFENPGKLGFERSGTALLAVNANVKGDVLLRAPFLAKGEVNLAGAQIGGGVDCDGGRFDNPIRKRIEDSGVALAAMSTKVAGDISLRAPFSAKGAVILVNVQIGGDLDCEGGKFQNPAQKGIEEGGTALTAANAKVTGDIFLREQFFAKGAG